MSNRSRSSARERTGALTVALHMREAVGYLAALASRSELDAVARKLLSVHVELGVEIAALTNEEHTVSSEPNGKQHRH